MKYLAVLMSEAFTRGVLLKKIFLEILQNSQENTCASSDFFFQILFLCLINYVEMVLPQKKKKRKNYLIVNFYG